MSPRTGRVRAARLTDLAALGELSRLAHSDDPNTQSLGIPVSGPRIGLFTLFRLPLGAFRPADLLYVYEEDGQLAGLLRVERELPRDDWTIVELDAIGTAEAGDVRYRLIQQLLREGSRRGAARFHCACVDVDQNVEIFMQAGFARYGEEVILFRQPALPLPAPWTGQQMQEASIRPVGQGDAVALFQLYQAATPSPVARLEAYRIQDWERQGTSWRVPRSSLAPILRFADVEAFVQEAPGGGESGTRLDAFVQIGVSDEDQPHYIKCMARPDVDTGAIIDFGLGVINERTAREAAHGQSHGIVSAVRTYESPIDRRLEDAGFIGVVTVTLLLKETLVRVAEPAFVPASAR
jgi:hypothetical protein